MRFNSPQEVEMVLDDEKYHDAIGKLQAFTLKFGGKFDSLTNRER